MAGIPPSSRPFHDLTPILWASVQRLRSPQTSVTSHRVTKCRQSLRAYGPPVESLRPSARLAPAPRQPRCTVSARFTSTSLRFHREMTPDSIDLSRPDLLRSAACPAGPRAWSQTPGCPPFPRRLLRERGRCEDCSSERPGRRLRIPLPLPQARTQVGLWG